MTDRETPAAMEGEIARLTRELDAARTPRETPDPSGGTMNDNEADTAPTRLFDNDRDLLMEFGQWIKDNFSGLLFEDGDEMTEAIDEFLGPERR